MKIVIPSKGRADIISTHLLFAHTAADYYIILHNEAERAAYLTNPTIPPERIIVSGVASGISLQRQWILDNLIADNEWFITMDDNLRKMIRWNDSLYQFARIPIEEKTKSAGYRLLAEYPMSIENFFTVCEEMVAVAEQRGARYCGFATTDNYLFRLRKWLDVGYVISKVALIKKSGIGYDPRILAMDDYGYTAENLLQFGRVLINRYVFPVGNHYQKGGIGTYPERLERKVSDCIYLMDKYPGLFRYNKKRTAHPRAELIVKYHTLEQIAHWRRSLLARA